MANQQPKKQVPAALLLLGCTPALVACLSWAWAKTVSDVVEEPYLDEIFHIPQAQAYCQENWRRWDPKITTPPGIYIISWLLSKVSLLECGVRELRGINGFLWFWACISLTQIKSCQAKGIPSFQERVQRAHTVFNVCLFPSIFFFSGLYYTDVASTATVLGAIGYFYDNQPGVGFFLFGFASLFFRQTNIFWVALFPAGLTLVSELCSQPGLNVFDPPVSQASAADYGRTITSIITNFLKLVGRITQDAGVLFNLVKSFASFGALLALFAGFVTWNGSVVLGDKTNHVATIHSPQVLYLFAYISFFSLPLIAPVVLAAITPRSFRPDMLGRFASRITPMSFLVAIFLACGVALPAIHFNTIVHPFTLADNRHYVFYVFRILRLNPALKYAAAPVYIILGWTLIQTLGLPHQSHTYSKEKKKDNESAQNAEDEDSVHVSYVLVWLAVSTLCLVSAPLVEPRYFVLPWMFWRLRVPHLGSSKAEGQGDDTRSAWSWRHLLHPDYRLYLETVWFMAINMITAYMFLYRGFEWPQEPGNVQRFLW